jgi:hypothetical protein
MFNLPTLQADESPIRYVSDPDSRTHPVVDTVAACVASLDFNKGFYSKTVANCFKNLYLVEDWINGGKILCPTPAHFSEAVEATTWFRFWSMEQKLRGMKVPSWAAAAANIIESEKLASDDVAPLLTMVDVHRNHLKLQAVQQEMAAAAIAPTPLPRTLITTNCRLLQQIYYPHLGDICWCVSTEYGVVCFYDSRPVFAPDEFEKILAFVPLREYRHGIPLVHVRLEEKVNN